MKNYFKYIAILALGMVACEPELENPIDEQGFYSNGEADFSNYVALGNSLTAGYADGSLYLSGQKNSYPNILSQQFSVVQDIEEFRQPLVNDNAGGLLAAGQPIPGFDTRLVLAFDEERNPSPQRYRGADPTTEVSAVMEGPFNNMGVPGAKSYHLITPNYGNLSGLTNQPATANPYFVRFASSPETTVLQDALAQNPSFFTLWIGNNDVLGYATSGGTGVDQTGAGISPAEYGMNDITDPMVFAGAYLQMVEALAGTASGGVLINIPDVTTVPYFTTVPYAPLSPADPDFGPQIPTLNATFAGLNQAFQALQVPERMISFSETAASPVLVKDESLTDLSQQITKVLTESGAVDAATAALYGMQFGQVRQATAEDLLVLTSSGVIGNINQQRVQELMNFGLDQTTAAQLSVNGVTFPLEDQYVLIPEEQQTIEAATTAYNQAIANAANQFDLGLLDVNAMLTQLANGGIPYDAGTINATFVTGGAFSLDGIHLTPRGYAVIANGIIEEINETYNAEVPKVNPGNYATVTLSQEVQ
ncbi:G-D-S-L family lipolytic protein [Zunongwangia sp. F363]|uniref:G-D-S-L family lipolytic protein n=1 Tax=Autumnicola tepida TaxID=3075595 RepID=A0ABU3CAF8_9FLAO|nr:G-D-S-L family lipolytic protein [Zunongwangia sp. F363]MDT0643328.1 G-D-S-L family lipolytic protein [Zunongwangia sp. F363]